MSYHSLTLAVIAFKKWSSLIKYQSLSQCLSSALTPKQGQVISIKPEIKSISIQIVYEMLVEETNESLVPLLTDFSSKHVLQ